MKNLFHIFYFAIFFNIFYIAAPRANYTEPFDLADQGDCPEFAPEFARRGKLYSLFENHTDHEIKGQFTYVFNKKKRCNHEMVTVELPTLRPKQGYLYSPEDENIEEYSLFLIEINDKVVYDNPCFLSPKAAVQHVLFKKNNIPGIFEPYTLILDLEKKFT